MKKIFVFVVILILCLSIFFSLGAQSQQSSQSTVEKQKTKIETFQSQTGTVVIKGYSEIGKLIVLGTIEIDAMEFTDTASNKKQSGIKIEIIESGRLENTDSSFIDYDEIDSLIKGIDYISKVNSSITKLDMFETTYKTKGYFQVTTFNNSSSKKIEAAISSGYIRPASAFLSLEQLLKFREMIVKAKEKIDSAK
jgi:hypothetical protein